jgi:ABC-type transport system substrate-binding protein
MPYIEEREWRVITDAPAIEAAFRSEQFQLWTLPDASYPERVKDLGGKIEMEEYNSLGFMALLANGTRPPWNDVRVREALYRVSNRKQYNDLLELGKATIPPGPLSAGLEGYQLDAAQTEKYFRQDARAARQLLDAAGFSADREVEITQINRQRDAQAGEIMQQQLAAAGVKSRITATPFAEWLQQRMTAGNWETFVTTFPGWDTPQAPLRLQHKTTNFPHVYSGLKDPAVDAMIEKSEVTLDRNERIKLVKEIQVALLDKYTPFIYVYTPRVFVARYRYVRDYEVNPSGNPMSRIDMWLDKA